MKKSILIVFTVMVCVVLAASAFAAGTPITPTSTTNIAGANFVPSTNVTLDAMSDTKDYCAVSAHAQSLGNAAGREWGTGTQAASAIYYIQPAPSTLTTCNAATNKPDADLGMKPQ